MTNINAYNLLNYTNASLNDSSNSSLSNLLDTANAAAQAAQTTTTPPTKATNSTSYMLNLSAEAQNYLSSDMVSSASSSMSSGAFRLSAQQEKQLNAIIQKYAGEPYSQETFDMIERDLVKSGLGPDQLAQQAKVNAFNPTFALLDALSGTNTMAGLIPSDSLLQTQIQSYVNDVAARFEKVAAPDDVATDTTVGGASA